MKNSVLLVLSALLLSACTQTPAPVILKGEVSYTRDYYMALDVDKAAAAARATTTPSAPSTHAAIPTDKNVASEEVTHLANIDRYGDFALSEEEQTIYWDDTRKQIIIPSEHDRVVVRGQITVTPAGARKPVNQS